MKNTLTIYRTCIYHIEHIEPCIYIYLQDRTVYNKEFLTVAILYFIIILSHDLYPGLVIDICEDGNSHSPKEGVKV